MKILCSTNIPYAEEAFQSLGDLTILSAKDITPDRVRDADVLVVRSTVKVNRALLEGSRVRFVGTSVIGTDHMDLKYLDQAGIVWRAAPGCNANSVSEYLVTALLCLARRHAFRLQGKTMAVIGVGHVGSRVADKARALGLTVLLNDPPRAEAEPNSAFLPLESILPKADIVTLHTPMEKGGRYPTYHLGHARFFTQLKPGCVFANVARGAIIDTDVLLAARASGRMAHIIMDTWEGEPAYRLDMLAQADIATPHIAGHSYEGKYIGTLMIYRALCQWLNRTPTWTPDAVLPPPLVPHIDLDVAGRDDEDVLWELVRHVYDIEADDRRLRASAVEDAAQRSTAFEHQRTEYPLHREFRFTQLTLRHASTPLKEKARGLGFQVE